MICPLCEAKDPPQPLHRFPPYTVARCPRCGLARLEPQPSAAELKSLYDSPHYYGGAAASAGYREDYASLQRCLRRSAARDLELLAPRVHGGDLLEVGCGYGAFLELARERGYRVRGLELSAAAAARAAAKLGAAVLRTTLEAYAAAHPDCADVIYCSHVIEHIPDPRAFVAAAARALRPGGFLLCITPNRRSLLARLSGRRWVSYKIPEHLFFFDPSTIGRLLAADFELAEVDPAWHYYPVPMVADRLRRLLDPLGRIVPRLEQRPSLARRMVRIQDGSMRVLARRR